MKSATFQSNQSLLALGSSIDLALLIPIIYFLCIRKTNIPKFTIVPVFIISLTIAFQVIPQGFHQTLTIIEYAAAPLELGLIGFLIYKVSQVRKSMKEQSASREDFPELLNQVLRELKFTNTQANIISSEVSLFYYTFMGWKKPESLDNHSFTYYQTSGYKNVFVVALFLLPVETFALHYWLATYSTTLAWILTAISIYSVFFILGDRNSIRHRPIKIGLETLHLRIGIRWNTSIHYDKIKAIELREADELSEKFANLATFGPGNVVIILKEPMKLKGIYGISKNTDRIALSMDNEKEFVSLLHEKITNS